jgi:hypothetical protein
MRKLTSRMTVLAVAGLLVACGGTTPTTATLPDSGGDDGVVASESLRVSPTTRIEPPKCAGQLTLRELGAGGGWTKMEASFIDVKGGLYFCGGVTFAITPDAELRSPRFNPNQVIVSGERGLYYLTAYAYESKVTVKVVIK